MKNYIKAISILSFILLFNVSSYAFANNEIRTKIEIFENSISDKNIDLTMSVFDKNATWNKTRTYYWAKDSIVEIFGYYDDIHLERKNIILSRKGGYDVSTTDYLLRAKIKKSGSLVEQPITFIFLWKNSGDGLKIIAMNHPNLLNDYSQISEPQTGLGSAIKLIAEADAYVYAYNYRNWNRSNRGRYDQLVAGWHPTGGESRAYIKFDLFGTDASKVNKAILKLYHFQTSGNNGVELGIYRVTSPWNEGSDTYHSGCKEKTASPGDISWVQQPKIDSAPIATFNPGTGMRDWTKINITSLVKQWLSGTPNYGLVIKPIGHLGRNISVSTYHFASRERKADLDNPKGESKVPMLILSENQNGGNAITQPPQQHHATKPTKSKFSCANQDNEEKGCCCFKGAHTYRFGSRHVRNVLTRFDTGRRFNCRSTVNLDVDRGNGWETVKTVQANSSREGSEVAPTDVLVPVNGAIEGFRISDGCACCIDSSEITLNADYPGGGLPQQPAGGIGKDIAIDGSGRPWVIGSDNGIYHGTGSGWVQQPGGGIGKDIAIDSEGRPWVIGSDNTIWYHDGNRWVQYFGEGKGLAIDVSSDGIPWVIGTDNRIYRGTGSGWVQQPGGGIGKDIAIDSEGRPWVIGSDNTIWYHDGNRWVQYPGGGRGYRISVYPKAKRMIAIASIAGQWNLNQDNGYTGTMTLQQNQSGRITGNAIWNGSLKGTINGKISGNTIEFTIRYSGGIEGLYRGILTQNGTRIINGTTEGNNGVSAHWEASR